MAARAPVLWLALVGGPCCPAAAQSVASAIATARPGDTVWVASGVHPGPLRIDKPIVLRGRPGAILDGSGRSTVLTVSAAARVEGLWVRGSGNTLAAEDAGILVIGASGAQIVDNVLSDVLFGIYVKESDSVRIQGNTIAGKAALPIALRGDGIRLWYSHRGSIADNALRDVRDLVIWFSDSTHVRDNVVRDSRYGLHFMYSHHNRFERNRFLENSIGAFLMYSSDITFSRNVFGHSRGASGKGLAFKDTDHVVATDNIMVKNAVGVYLDNSPSARDAVNRFVGNILAFNDVGVALLPSVRDNLFRGNQFVDNLQPVAVTGSGTALGNGWDGNYWSEYAGFDRDGNGAGDTPYVRERLADDLMARYEALQIFTMSPAIAVLDLLGRVLPVLAPRPIVIDSLPRLGAAVLPVRRQSVAEDPPPWPATAFLLLSITGLMTAYRLHRSSGRIR